MPNIKRTDFFSEDPVFLGYDKASLEILFWTFWDSKVA